MVITLPIKLKIEQNYNQKKCNSNSSNEEERIITGLKIYKSRSMFRNQPHKLNLHSNAHNYANATPNWTILPSKEVKSQEFTNDMHIKAIWCMLSSKCFKTYCAPWFKICARTSLKKREVNVYFDYVLRWRTKFS